MIDIKDTYYFWMIKLQLFWFLTMIKKKVAFVTGGSGGIGKRSFNGEVERIPSQGLNAINSCPTNAIFVLKMFLKTI